MKRKEFLPVLLGLLCFPGSVFAQAEADPCAADSSRIYELEAVSVTGSRIPMRLGRSARMVTVLDSLALAAAPVQSVNDLLKYAAGVDVRQRGAMGVQTDIGIRGGTGNQVAVLLNGINVCDPQTGHNAVDLPVDLSDIERIEILEGPAGRVYGTSSLSGAINIVTRDRGGWEARLEGGSHGFLSAGAAAGLRTGRRTSHRLSLSGLRTGGYSRSRAGRLNSDCRTLKSFYQGKFRSDAIDLDWSVGASSRSFGANTFYSAAYDDQFEHTEKIFTAVRGTVKGKVQLKPALYWNHFRDRFELFRGAPDIYPFNFHRTNVFGGNLSAILAWKLGKTALGTEIRREDIVSTNLGEPLSRPRKAQGSEYDYVVGLARTNINLFLEHNVLLPRWTFSAGVIAARNTGNDDGMRFYPGADASFRLTDRLKIYASYNSSLRMPTFTELYYSVGGHKADRNLKIEKMQAVEGGVKYLRRGFSARASVFYHHAGDLIDWMKDFSRGPGAPWMSVNHAVLNSIGEELFLEFEFPELLRRRDFFVRDLRISYARIDRDKVEEEGFESKSSLKYLRGKFVAQAGFRLWKQLMLHLSVRWQDRVGHYEKYEAGSSTGTLVPFDPYSVVDARLSWNASWCRVYLSCNNLLDTSWYDYGNIPQPGIWFRGGFVFQFREAPSKE